MPPPLPPLTLLPATNTKRQEKAAIKRALKNTFILPIHDYPARIDLSTGRVVARLTDSVPGPETPVDQKLPSETGVIVGV